MLSQNRYTAYKLLVIVLLAFASLAFMVALRYIVSGKFRQGHLVWNLFLAALPIFIAYFGSELSSRVSSRKKQSFWGLLTFFAWLLFYPNAPYIFTDFIHVIRRSNLGTPAASWLSELDLLWFDIVLNSAFAFVGHYLGLVSMNIIHSRMKKLFGNGVGWALLAPAMLFSGFGIHIGRFSRFNSWDIVFNPLDAFSAIFKTFASPSAIWFSFAFAFFIGLTYLIFYLGQRDIKPLEKK